MKRAMLCAFLLFVMLCLSFTGNAATQNDFMSSTIGSRKDSSTVSVDTGVPHSETSYIVIELASGDIPARGNEWAQLMTSKGIPTMVLRANDGLSNLSLIHDAPVIIFDGSMASFNGSLVSQSLLDSIIKEDISIILTGRSAWLLHRITNREPPSLTAPIETSLYSLPDYSGAVFLSYPTLLSIGQSVTSESNLMLPLDTVQTDISRLANLTSSSSITRIAPLRYDSWPLDIFMFAPEDPTLLTATGKGLLTNIIAYCTALRESPTASALSQLQAPEGSLLSGGMSYMHEPTISSTYYAVHAMESLLTGPQWTDWVSTNAPLVHSILSSLLVEHGSESAFMTSRTEGVVDCRSTAEGLWLVSTMGLTSQFSVSQLATYLSERQDSDGGFENYITSTYHVTEALSISGQLSSINAVQLETWLRSLVIDGSKTSDPNLWGAIGANPSSTSPLNNYAVEYLRSLSFLGKTHLDPAKLTSWILSRTSNGDGSYRNSIGPDEEVVTGTVSALASMQILGTLTSSNKTSGLAWLVENQLSSGGFGLKSAASDLVGKTRETSRVAICLKILSVTSGSLSLGIVSYINAITTQTGFEAMDFLPSLMWTSWLLDITRLSHASPSINLFQASEYISCFNKLTIYPFWSNLTTATSPEYSTNQYRTKSVWTQYFGVTAAQDLSIELSPDVVSDIVLYLSQCQYATGQYRPTPLMGTAHMQFSVAAVETLFLLGKLNTIAYRSELETAILSEYNNGLWNMSGWTLSPFAASQEAVDYLSTRAALRMGLITPTMAAEIAANINARIQYTDLVALSWDVATLSLLQTSAFSVDLKLVDPSLVLSALRSSHFSDGWFNASKLWQPVYSSSVLRMVSVLGLRCLLYNTSGSNISASCTMEAQLGAMLEISVNITSGWASHSVLVQAFGESLLFTNVENSDTLFLPIPSSAQILGFNTAFLIILDWGCVRAFDSIGISILGALEGSMALTTPVVKMGESINGTAQWSLLFGEDSGLSHIIVALGEPSISQWSLDSISLLSFSLPTTNIDAGTYPLTVTIEVPYCAPLILNQNVTIVEPNPTHVLATSDSDGNVGHEMNIDWSLHYAENDSLIADQVVTLIINDSSDSTVFTETMISTLESQSFHWTPTEMGDFAIYLIFNGNGTLERSQVMWAVHIYQETTLSWIGSDILGQHTTAIFSVLLATAQGEGIGGQSVHIVVTAPSSAIVIDLWPITNSSGHAIITFSLTQNGVYLLQTQYLSSGFLLGSTASDSVISWSSSHLDLGGIQSEVTIGETYRLWAHLEDNLSTPLPGQQVLLRITLLPSTVLIEQSLITNSSGFVILQWTTGSAGSYRFDAVYGGTISRAPANETVNFDVFIPVTLSIVASSSMEAGLRELIQIGAADHLENPVSSVIISIVIYGPEGQILYSNSSSIKDGSVTFFWTPSARGLNTISVSMVRQGLYDASSSTETVEVYETATIALELPENISATSVIIINVSVVDHGLQAVQGIVVHVEILLNAQSLLNSDLLTDSNGYLSIHVPIAAPGLLKVETLISPQGWFLEVSHIEAMTVVATTTLIITIPGQPVVQGSTVGILISLDDFSGDPLVGASVQINITSNDGIVIRSVSRTTDVGGHCTLAQTFNSVGDFIVRAFYAGYNLNASAIQSVPQRVFVVPSITVAVNPSYIVGEPVEFQVNLTDVFGNFIPGRYLILSVEQDGSIVFETQLQLQSIPSLVTWYPTQGGLAIVTITHIGDIHYLAATKTTTTSIMELVSGSLVVSPNEINLFQSTMLVYALQSSPPSNGVIIHFEVLGMDLVPVWSADVLTNSSGIASVIYTAVETYGVLHANAGPDVGEFLIGGDEQEQLVVKTFSHVSVFLLPIPPCARNPVNITITVTDDLGGNINGPAVTVSLYNPYGEIVKLSTWTNSIAVPLEDGLVFVEFTPTMVGLYTVILSSSGSVAVNEFTSTTHHTVYSATRIQLNVSTYELEVGQTLNMMARLVDHNNIGLSGRNIVLYLDGPGASSVGPVVLVTNSTGYAAWSAIINTEGFWTLEATFNGLGVYLSSSESADINVRYGTVVELSLETFGDIVAGVTETNFSILLIDTGGTPLEGFTIHYEVHHDTLGLVTQGSIVQTDTNPVTLYIVFSQMGEYTLLVTFIGTSHYHPSNAALQFFVFGISAVVSDIHSRIDRSSSDVAQIFIEDEVGTPISLSELNVAIELHGPLGTIDLSDRLVWNESCVSFTMYGLSIGDYTLSITVSNDERRLGCSEEIQFRIVSATYLSIPVSTLPGLISEPHSITFYLIDSLNDSVDSADIWVSLYDPLGREIFGHPLTTRTLLESSLTGTVVSWTPSLVGEYRIILVFEGNDFLNATSLEMNVHIFYASTLSLNAPSQSYYGDIVPVSVTLRGATSGISGATISISVFMRGETEQELTLTTGSRGVVNTNLVGLLAGTHTIMIEFSGSDTQASCLVNFTIDINPIVVIDLKQTGVLYAANNCSANLSISVLGASSIWNGSVEAVLFSPAGNRIRTWNFDIHAYAVLELRFFAAVEGNYTLNVTISGLPLIIESFYPLTIAVIGQSLVLQLDVETTPMFGGIGILAIVGIAIRRRLKGMLESVASEWRE